MAASIPDEKRMIAYLLGEMSEPEQEAFERSCLDDDQLFEQLLAAEAELTDDYVRGALVGRRREAFEQRLVNSPERAEETRLARLIAQTGGPVRKKVPAQTMIPRQWPALAWFTRGHTFSRIAFASAAVILIAIGLLVWKKNVFHQPEQAQEPAVANQNSTPAPTPAVATFVLVAGGERDRGNINEIKIPPSSNTVRLQISLGADTYPSYGAALKPLGGPTRWTLRDLKPASAAAGEILVVELPAASLPEGDSILTITGSRDEQVQQVVGRYFLRRLP